MLSLPVAAETRHVEDAQGTVGIFFHVGQRVFATTNKHVLSAEGQLYQDYVYGGGGAPRPKVRLLGERGYEETVGDTRLAVDTMVDEALRLRQEVKRLTKELDAATDYDENDENDDARQGLQRTIARLTEMKTDSVALQKFFNTILTQWNKLEKRTIGHTAWAPAISHTVNNTHHTRDIGVFELVPEKFARAFRGNLVDLGA